MLENLLFVNAEFPWFFRVAVFMFGACWGSFLNVVIYRVPAEKSVIKPRSQCVCGEWIAWYDNIPILSWFILRGKARCCGQRFSFRYPAVEILTGLLFLASWWMHQDNLTVALAGWVFIGLLVSGTFIDLDHMVLPDFCTVGGAVIGVLLAFAFPMLHGYGSGELWLINGMRAAIIAMLGAIVGSAVILWIAMIAQTVLKKEAMGFGDVLFMGCIGAFCGWQGALFAIFGGALLGTVIVIPMMILQKMGLAVSPGRVENDSAKLAEDEPAPKGDVKDGGETEGEAGKDDLQIGSAIPFGPWLALGGLVYYLFVSDYVDAYFGEVAYVLFTPVG